MTRVFVLTQSRLARTHRMVWSDPLQGLNACLLVDADRVNAIPLIGFDRLSIRLANGRDAMLVKRIGFVFACQPILVLMRPDFCTPKKLVNPAPADRLKYLLSDQIQTKFASTPSGDRPFVFLGSSQAVLKIAACCSGVTRGRRPVRCRSDNSLVISDSRMCRGWLHSISTSRSQLSRHLRRHRPTVSCCSPTSVSIASLLWPSNARRIMVLR